LNPFVNVADCVSGLVTVTFTGPSALLGEAGVVAFSCVLLTKVTFGLAVEPKVTDAPRMKLVPVIVTTVPPAGGPLTGARDVMVGAGFVAHAAALNTRSAEIAFIPTYERLFVFLKFMSLAFSEFVMTGYAMPPVFLPASFCVKS